jgi:gluconolactonase
MKTKYLTIRGIAIALSLMAGVIAPVRSQNQSVDASKPIPGIGPVGEIIKLHTGFTFTEGPAADKDGNLFFTDVRSNRIHKVDTRGRLSTFMENTRGANGLMVDLRGRLIACQGLEGRIVAIDTLTKNVQVVADNYNGNRFIMPNDLVVDRHGGIYFTDPAFRTGPRPQDKEGVYYVSNAGQVIRLIDDLTKPNGIILSPDEKTLYVLPSSFQGLMAYPIEKPGRIGQGKRIGNVEHPGDGMTVDIKGNLYVTQPGLSTIQMVSPEGKTLGFISFPEVPSNCKFGGKEMKVLFVTARTSLYAVAMEQTGYRFGLSSE